MVWYAPPLPNLSKNAPTGNHGPGTGHGKRSPSPHGFLKTIFPVYRLASRRVPSRVKLKNGGGSTQWKPPFFNWKAKRPLIGHPESSLSAGVMILGFKDHYPCLPARAGGWGQRPMDKKSDGERSERRRGHGEAVGRSDRRERRVGNKKAYAAKPHSFCPWQAERAAPKARRREGCVEAAKPSRRDGAKRNPKQPGPKGHALLSFFK